MSDLFELPYAGTSGHSGTDTSKERAVREDGDGTTARRQNEAMAWLGYASVRGMTWKELANALNLHHGSASGVLSVLHKTGHIARLAERRNGCKVYVLPACVQGREVEQFGREKCCPHCGGAL